MKKYVFKVKDYHPVYFDIKNQCYKSRKNNKFIVYDPNEFMNKLNSLVDTMQLV